MKTRHVTKSGFGMSLFVLAVVFLIYGTMFCWGLRDGLGLDVIQSRGMTAFRRFVEAFWPVAVMALSIGAFGLWLAQKRKEPIQPPQRNAGSRPSSGDSSASESPSSLSPRG